MATITREPTGQEYKEAMEYGHLLSCISGLKNALIARHKALKDLKDSLSELAQRLEEYTKKHETS